MNQPSAPRYDIYAFIHKGLRASMTDALVRVGRLDAHDAAEVAEVAAEVSSLLDFCSSHAKHENSVVHAAIEARSPGATRKVAVEHEQYERDIILMRGLLGSLPGNPAAAHALYHALSVFVAENLAHMHDEETHHNALLWETHSDAEIHALHERILAGLKPEESRLALRWMLPHMSAQERAGVLGGMRQAAPAEVFDGVVEMLRPLLGSRDQRKLDAALAR